VGATGTRLRICVQLDREHAIQYRYAVFERNAH